MKAKDYFNLPVDVQLGTWVVIILPVAPNHAEGDLTHIHWI